MRLENTKYIKLGTVSMETVSREKGYVFHGYDKTLVLIPRVFSMCVENFMCIGITV